MKVESASGIVHSASIYESSRRYVHDIIKTKCGRRLVISSFIPEDGWGRTTSKAITCKKCKK